LSLTILAIKEGAPLKIKNYYYDAVTNLFDFGITRQSPHKNLAAQF